MWKDEKILVMLLGHRGQVILDPVLSWNEVHINDPTWRVVASNGPHMAVYPQI